MCFWIVFSKQKKNNSQDNLPTAENNKLELSTKLKNEIKKNYDFKN